MRWRRNRWMAVTGVLWGLLALLIIAACTAPETPAPLTWKEIRETELTPEEIQPPIFMCEEFVKDRLKAPRTAQFPRWFEYQFNRLIDPEYGYNIEGFVDSENSFGALVRSRFTCKVRQATEERWELLSLNIQ
jgi:hypothetical protein